MFLWLNPRLSPVAHELTSTARTNSHTNPSKSNPLQPPAMRLINSQTLLLHYFMDNEIPPYAILSHTWDKDEISFQEMSNPSSTTLQKAGYIKIKNCCEIALKDGFPYCWIDTICIDKSSSSELSEAINSMYQWYEKAEVCYAYIADYTAGTERGVPGKGFGESRWFTRGWTLQELIAPRHVLFFNAVWEDIGSKSSLRVLVARITGVHVEALLGRRLQLYSLAQRMSWASKRHTTRIEDIAYCLLGIFQVNMPMLYGEGSRAFIRLQEAIMTRSTDHTLFAWENRLESGAGLLASSPSYFQNSPNTIRAFANFSHPFTVTNKGIRFELPISRDPVNNEVLAVLDCRYVSQPEKFIALRLNAFYNASEVFYVSARNRLVLVNPEERRKENIETVYLMGSSTLEAVAENQYRRILLDATSLRTISFELTLPSSISSSKCSSTSLQLLEMGYLNWVLLNLRDSIGNTCDLGVVELATSEWGLELVNHWESTVNNISNHASAWDIKPDRLLWQHPKGKWWISAMLKRRVVDGEKVTVLIIGEDVV